MENADRARWGSGRTAKQSTARIEPRTALSRHNRPILRFVGSYLGLLVLFQVVYYQFIIDSAPFRSYLTASGRAAAILLSLVGEQVIVTGDSMVGRFSMSIKVGCDGLQAMAILAIGVLAFPGGGWKKKLLGTATGIVLLLALNVMRLASLYWMGSRARSLFQTLHVHVWPAVLIVAAAFFWIAWALHATRAAHEVEYP